MFTDPNEDIEFNILVDPTLEIADIAAIFGSGYNLVNDTGIDGYGQYRVRNTLCGDKPGKYDADIAQLNKARTQELRELEELFRISNEHTQRLEGCPECR